MNRALILILRDDLNGEMGLTIDGGGLDLENPLHQREAVNMLRAAENTIMDWILKPPCPDCEDKDGE